jgi:hypothetical protein
LAEILHAQGSYQLEKNVLPFVHNVGLPSHHHHKLSGQNSLTGLLRRQTLSATFSLIFATTEPVECGRAEL